MLQIRFNRVGKRNRSQYRIVLQEHTVAPGGRHVEVLGGYDPHTKVAVLKDERIKYWLSQGAQTSDSAFNLFVSKGLVEAKKRAIKMERPKAVVVEEAPKEESKKEEPTATEAKA